MADFTNNNDSNNMLTNIDDSDNTNEKVTSFDDNFEIVPNQIVSNIFTTINLNNNFDNQNEHKHEHEHEHEHNHEHDEHEHEHEYDEHDEHEHDEHDEHNEYDEHEGEQDLVNVLNMNQDMVNQMEEQVNLKVQEYMGWAWENTFNVNFDILEKLNILYLKNLQYDDDEIDCIRYTVRSAFNSIRDWDIKYIVQGLFYFGIGGLNVIFEKNSDLLNEIIKSELQLILRRSFMFIILNNLIEQQVNMEDVKMILTTEELNNVGSSNFKDLDDKIKQSNEACTICQEEFRDNDEIRILSCDHVFHLDCIDPWLTKHSHTCPSCRKPAGKATPNTTINE